MSALGIPTQINRGQPLTRFQFYLGLADALRCKPSADSSHLKELANSFSHDVLNIAALAGRLLWYEGVTPDIWRSHDLIAVGLDAEAFYVMLQSACDIMADVIATLGAKKGQAPRDSFHGLHEWVLRNPNRLDSAYHLIGAKLPWFKKINSQRTAIVHRGQTILISTNRVSFNRGELIRELRDLTRSTLAFSERLAAKILSESERQKNSEKTVIDGVYVPALKHLLNEYRVPTKSKDLKLKAQCLAACGGYVEAAYIGYPNGFWWNVFTSSTKALKGCPTSAAIHDTGDDVHNCRFAISAGNKRYGFIACDRGETNPVWLSGAASSAREFQAMTDANRTALIVRELNGSAPKFLPRTKIPVISGSDPSEVVQAYVRAMLD